MVFENKYIFWRYSKQYLLKATLDLKWIKIVRPDDKIILYSLIFKFLYRNYAQSLSYQTNEKESLKYVFLSYYLGQHLKPGQLLYQPPAAHLTVWTGEPIARS